MQKDSTLNPLIIQILEQNQTREMPPDDSYGIHQINREHKEPMKKITIDIPSRDMKRMLRIIELRQPVQRLKITWSAFIRKILADALDQMERSNHGEGSKPEGD